MREEVLPAIGTRYTSNETVVSFSDLKEDVDNAITDENDEELKEDVLDLITTLENHANDSEKVVCLADIRVIEDALEERSLASFPILFTGLLSGIKSIFGTPTRPPYGA